MNNVSMIGTVSGVPRSERDGAWRWAALSLVVRCGTGVERFEVIAEGRAREVVLERSGSTTDRLAIDGHLGRGPSGGIVVIAEHALWLSTRDVAELVAAIKPIPNGA